MRTIRFSLLCAALALSANAATLIHTYTFTGNFNDETGSLNGTAQNEANVAGNVLNLDGTMNQEAGPFAGLPVDQARKAVVARLERTKRPLLLGRLRLARERGQ